MFGKVTRGTDRLYTALIIAGAVFFIILLHVMFSLGGVQGKYDVRDPANWKIGFAAFVAFVALCLCLFSFMRQFIYPFVIGLAIFDFFIAMCPSIVFSKTVGILVAIIAVALAVLKYYANTGRTAFAYMNSESLPGWKYSSAKYPTLGETAESVKTGLAKLVDNFYIRVFTALLVMCVFAGCIWAVTGTYKEFMHQHAATSPIGWVIFGVAVIAFFACLIPHTARYVYSFSLGAAVGMIIPAAINQTAANLPVYAIIGTAAGAVTAALYSHWKPQEEKYSIIKLIKNPKRLLCNPNTVTQYERTPPSPEGIRFYQAEDGHEVRSKAELKIDNWLYEHGIEHVYEPQIPNTKYYSDFYLSDYDVYIEYWGLFESGDPEYDGRTWKKTKLYRKKKLKFLGLFEKDLENLDDILMRGIKDRLEGR